MSKSKCFSAPGSPLHGRKIPLDWQRMDPNAKRRALISYGYAYDFQRACQVMGQHAAAMTRKRRTKQEYAAKRRHPEGKD
jgi:hypothetical protein